jgi:hypothetical protein
MSNNLIWNDLIRELKNILLEGYSNFEGIMALNEIINIIFLKYGELNNNKKKSVYTTNYYIKNIYKKYCEKYNNLENKNKINNKIDDQITKLYHFMYGTENNSMINKFSDQFGILLHTNFTIEHKYDLTNLIIKIHHTFNKKKIIFGKYMIDYMYTYLQKHDSRLFLQDYMVDSVVNEIEPEYDEIGSDESCGIGNFLVSGHNYILKHNENGDSDMNIFNNISGYVYNENIYKFAIFNLLCNNINFKNVRYDTFLDEINYDKNETCDYVIGCYDVTDKCELDVPKNIKFEISAKNNIAMQIQMCLHKLKKGGRCGLILPQSILYNNGINKNAPDLSKKLMMTWEYQIKILLLEKNNLYKIIFFPEKDLAAIFFIKGYPTNNIQFVDQASDNTIKVNINRIKENNYCLMFSMYEEIKEIYTSDQLRGINLVQSKVIMCNIDDEKHDRLNYRNIMHTIFLKIGKREKVKKNTHINIEYGNYTDKGYKYMEDLDMSVQGTDAKMTLKEIILQCKKNKIKLEIEIQLNDSSKMRIVCE